MPTLRFSTADPEPVGAYLPLRKGEEKNREEGIRCFTHAAEAGWVRAPSVLPFAGIPAVTDARPFARFEVSRVSRWEGPFVGIPANPGAVSLLLRGGRDAKFYQYGLGVTKTILAGDEKLLVVFTQALKEINQQPPDFSQGISVAALPSRYSPYERLLLSTDHVGFFRAGSTVATQVSTSEIREISVVCSFCTWESISLQVVLKNKTRLTCDIQLKDVVTTVQWMRATLPDGAQRTAAHSESGNGSFVPQPIRDSGH